MHSEEYEKYIRSPAWEQMKRKRMEIDGYRCVCCGRHADRCRTMQVHHVTYERLGHEDPYEDLCTVCGSCHKKLHSYYARKRKPC